MRVTWVGWLSRSQKFLVGLNFFIHAGQCFLHVLNIFVSVNFSYVGQFFSASGFGLANLQIANK